jgi:hypothetical protein
MTKQWTLTILIIICTKFRHLQLLFSLMYADIKISEKSDILNYFLRPLL